MPLLIEYYVVLLLYNTAKKNSIIKCPKRALKILEKSSYFRHLNFRRI
jgi:hypothetical protein